jgi:RluA family pseudouridine synthase
MEILHANDAFIVLNKPPGIASVPGSWADALPAENLVDLLTPSYGKIWIVHRLDKGTSGVILFARTADSHRALSTLFESHLVRKVYHALVCGIPAWQEHTARHLLRQDVGHSHRTVVDHIRGKSAVTHFRVLECFSSHAFLQAVTESGRTHQVRAHAAALGYPLLGDELYGTPPTEIISRPALHANSLEFDYDGQAFSFTAPYPQDFQSALASLQGRG